MGQRIPFLVGQQQKSHSQDHVRPMSWFVHVLASSCNTGQASPRGWINRVVQSPATANSCISIIGSSSREADPVWLPDCCVPATHRACPQVSPSSVLCTCCFLCLEHPSTLCSPAACHAPHSDKLTSIHLTELNQRSPDGGPALSNAPGTPCFSFIPPAATHLECARLCFECFTFANLLTHGTPMSKYYDYSLITEDQDEVQRG